MSENKDVNRLFLGIVLFYVLGSTAIGYAVPRGTSIYILLLLSQLLILIPAVCYCWIKKINITRLVPFKKIKFSTGILIVVVTYLMYPLMIVLNAITLFFTESGTQAMFQGQAQQGGGFLAGVLFIAVIPAFTEELVFRGILFQTYRKSSLLFGILLSGFLFGIMHMNLNQMVYAFAMGIGTAFLVEGTGSILSSMLAHFTLNFTGVAMTQMLQMFSSRTGVAAENTQQGNYLQMGEGVVVILLVVLLIWSAIAVGTTTAAVAIYIYICKANHRWDLIKQKIREKCSDRMITIPLVIAVGISIGIILLEL